jgi:nucleoside-diphosphate-sugar epimerase
VPAGDAHFVGVADNSKARAVLGWKPKTSLKDGMQQTLDQMSADQEE